MLLNGAPINSALLKGAPVLARFDLQPKQGEKSIIQVASLGKL